MTPTLAPTRPSPTSMTLMATLCAFSTAFLLAACDLGVQDAHHIPDPGPRKDRILERKAGIYPDTSSELREMFAASTRPKAVIRWLDNDSAWSGRYRGMVLDVEASWPEYTIVFRHPEDFFSPQDAKKPRYKFGLLALANDGDGDGRIFSWDRNGSSQAERVEPPDSLAAEYRRFQYEVEVAAACATTECKQRKAAELESWSDSLEASAPENGFRAAQRKGTATDWYMGENGRILVVWVPDAFALGQLNQGRDKQCAGTGNDLRIGYNFRLIDRPFPRVKETMASQQGVTAGVDPFIFWAGVEDLEDRSITYGCSVDAWSTFGFSPRMFSAVPPEFQLGLEDMPPWK